MSSDGDHEGVVTDAEASAGYPPAGEASATSSRRRRRGAPEARLGGRAPGRRPQGATPAGAPGSRYAIRVEGLLDAHWSEWLGGMTITHEAGGLTRLEGAVMDQAALHGLLIKIRDLRLTIVTLERLGAVDTVAPSSQEPPEGTA